jgi:hypothetical protein
MHTEKGKARFNKLVQEEAARPQNPAVALGCKSENAEQLKRDLKEAGVDLQIVIDPGAPGLCYLLTESELQERFPEHAQSRASRPRLKEAEGNTEGEPDVIIRGELRIVIHNPEVSQTVRVETGPEATSIHLGEG